MAASLDPVRSGLVASLAHPGGNVTGTDVFSAELSQKRLEMLKVALPGASRVTVLWNVANPALIPEWQQTEVAAEQLRVQLESVELHGPEDFESAFAAIGERQPDALLTLHDTLTIARVGPIVDFTAKHRLPALYAFRNFVDAGGLLSYGPNLLDGFRRAAYFVDRILKGAKPGDLPVERPMRFELVVNMKTARELGLTFPQEILLQVTEVVE
jgi:putative ABC transport system substrate-binding protein